MKHLITYNESVRDQMTAKELDNNKQMIYDAIMDLKSIDIPVNSITTKNGSYGFTIYNYDKKISIFYNDEEEIKKTDIKKQELKKKTFGWHMYVINASTNTPTGFSSNLIIPEENTWNSIFLEIINMIYPNVNNKREEAIKSLIKLEDKIEIKKELIEILDKVLKIKNKIK